MGVRESDGAVAVRHCDAITPIDAAGEHAQASIHLVEASVIGGVGEGRASAIGSVEGGALPLASPARRSILANDSLASI